MKNRNVLSPKRKIQIRALLIAGAAIGMIAALFFMWWKGLFLPRWIDWKEEEFVYEGASVSLKHRTLTIVDNAGTDMSEDNKTTCSASEKTLEQTLFETPWDYSVQDVIPMDINKDGKEELVMLVWKHGSYGKHKPIWVMHNDIRLEQHIFIYQWDESRQNKLRAIWMSSALGYDVSSIARAEGENLIITRRTEQECQDNAGQSNANGNEQGCGQSNANGNEQGCGQSSIYTWQGFGLKYLKAATSRKASIVCAGDNLIHTNLLLSDRTGNADYDYFYENIIEEISEADFATINQETIFVEDRGLISDYPRFGTPLEIGEAIVNAGFDMVTLANNHVLDKGTYGIEVTTDFYDKKGIIYTGVNPKYQNSAAKSIKFVWIQGIKVALLNYTYGTNGIPSPEENPYLIERLDDKERVIRQLDYARSRADAVIVFVHWGDEYSFEINEEQKEFADCFSEHNVDVVIGTHPHVLQPIEMLEGKDGHNTLIYYSLGNLISGQKAEECLVGGLAEFTFEKDTDGQITVKDYTLQKVITEQKKGYDTVNLFED